MFGKLSKNDKFDKYLQNIAKFKIISVIDIDRH